jgi:diguanylate cyclase (GGDEF)-like protein
MMFDIDHFKLCNDTFGHRAGDHVLRHIADIVRQRARKVDVVARYGGEEFAVILPEIDLEGSAQFGETVRKLVEDAEFTFEGRTIPVAISVGIADLEPSIANADDLVKRADARLYKAKQNGRNQVVWTDDGDERADGPSVH